MRYITHHRYKEQSLSGRLNIPYGTVLDAPGDILLLGDKPVCARTSENAKLHFAPDDDGRGLERGALTYAIAFAPRKGCIGQRFADAEIEVLMSRWKRFLRQDVDTILFNEAFFAADIDDLKELADTFNIIPKRT